MIASFLRRLALIAVTLPALVLPGVAVAQVQGGDWHGPGMWTSGWGGWFFGPLMMLAFLAITVVVIVLIVRWLGGGPYHGSHGTGMPGSSDKTDRALDILRQRYAHGEISREEFEERRGVLSGD